jgi:hypothetical protein
MVASKVHLQDWSIHNPTGLAILARDTFLGISTQQLWSLEIVIFSLFAGLSDESRFLQRCEHVWNAGAAMVVTIITDAPPERTDKHSLANPELANLEASPVLVWLGGATNDRFAVTLPRYGDGRGEDLLPAFRYQHAQAQRTSCSQSDDRRKDLVCSARAARMPTGSGGL